MASKIYITPSYGNFEGQLLVFDTVESMTHVRASKTPQHPVEHLDKGMADHRFREGVKIQIVGMISDNWTTAIKEEPTPQFKTSTDKQQQAIRTKLEQQFQEDTNNEIFKTTNDYNLVSEVVQKILDKKEVRPRDFEEAKAISPFWVIMATQTIDRERDEVSLIRDKQLKNSNNSLTNNYTMEDQNSTITQAREFLTELDKESILCTVVSMFEVYDNMVLTSFNNALRNGPQRGGYWVSLSFSEQLVASTVTKELVVDEKETEVANENKDKGRQEPVVIDKSDTVYKDLLQLWEDLLKKRDSEGQGPKIRKYSRVVTNNKTAKETILEDVYRSYATKLSDKETATKDARLSINSGMLRILAKQGKL